MALAQGTPSGLPDLGDLAYLAEAMTRLGPLRAGAMELRAADWPEILPFASLTAQIVTPWDAEALHQMCAAYYVESEAGKDPLSIPPVDREKADPD